MNDRINVISAQIAVVKRKRNDVLEIENLLFKYNVDKNAVNYKEMQKLTIDDFNKLMELMEEENTQSLTEKFQNSNNIIKLYDELVGDLKEIPDATQYDDAVTWLNQIGRVLTQHINTYSLNQEEDIQSLENTKGLITKYLNHFQGDQLIKEILSPSEFDDLLDKSGLGLTTKVALKKEIGQINYNLNFPKDKQQEDYVAKYRLVYEKKSQVYQKEIEKILDICENNTIILKTDIALEQINQISAFIPDYSYKQVQNAVVVILLKDTLSLYDNLGDYENVIKKQLIDDCETLLIISRKHAPKEEFKQLESFSNKIVDDAQKIISKAQKIIEKEEQVLAEKNYNSLEEYYQKISLNAGDDEQLTLAIVVSSIKQSIELLENFIEGYKNAPDLYIKNCQEQILNITEYIETYEILIKRVYEKEEKPTSQNILQKK
ncbi:MAG: hypothetical protein PHG03_03550 [Bacilli bacterium]|nr:hypothetical protein [Bacilli bacterium]